MDKSKNQSIEEAYKICLKKACTNKEIPCKEKYVRRLIDAAHSDRSGVYFFVSFDTMVKINDPIVRFKCFMLFHILFRDCPFSKRLLSYGNSMLNQIEKPEFKNFIYCKLCDLYQELIFYKVQFLTKFTFLSMNYNLSENSSKIPFMTNIARIAFLKDLGSHFTLHCKLLNEILKNTQYVGIDPSIILSNQCQMRALVPILKDIHDIFTLMQKTATEISEFPEIDASILRIFEISFIPHFKIYKKILDKISYITYIIEQYSLPKLPDTYPFLSQSFYKKIPPKPERTEKLVTAMTPPRYERMASQKSISFSANDLTMNPAIINSQPFTSPVIQEKPINIINSTLELRVQELEEKLKDYDEISIKNANLLSKLSELMEKTQNLSRVNEELRTKLDSEKIISAERDVLKRKFDSISELYTEIRSRYKNLCEQKSQSSQEYQAYLLDNQRLLEENSMIKMQLEKYIEDLKTLNDENKSLNAHIAQNSVQDKQNALFDLLKTIVSENQKIYENHCEDYVCFENISKASLIKIFNDASQKIKVLSYQICHDPQDIHNLMIVQALIQHNSTVLFDYCRQYLNTSYDEEFDKHFQKLNSLYTGSMNILNQNPSDFNITKYTQEFQNITELMINRINDKGEIFSTAAENIKNFDFESEMKNVLNALEEAMEKLKKDEELENELNESEIQLNSGTNDILELLRRLIETTRKIESEIMSKDGVKPTDRQLFYQKNSAWASGLVGFAKSITQTVKTLIETIDGFGKGEVFMDELTVSLNNVTTLVTQLLVSTRIKADKFSPNLTIMSQIYIAIKAKINEISTNAKKSLSNRDTPQIDISNLSQTKRIAMENDIQIRILGLEGELENERKKLCRLREQQYKK